MKPIVIIDGYNFIHHIPQLKTLLNTSLEAARNKLEQILAEYLLVKKIKIILVYDGSITGSAPKYAHLPDLQIYFSKPPQKADPEIKRIIQQHYKKAQLQLVSLDNELIHYARIHKAAVLTPVDFINRIKGEQETFDLSQKYNNTMSEAELQEWLKLFDVDSDNHEGKRGS
ncbi:NYN domain-containing protein [candidate division KSB1 bacterium]|nr:NYN domain-containing protein [candidate division KSB1 bacterium]